MEHFAARAEGGIDPLVVIDAVLPLTRRDVPRARILRTSLEKFFCDLGTCWVITPDLDARVIEPHFDDRRYRIIPESTVVPELSWYGALRRIALRPPAEGWLIQQLIKLAAADIVGTEFYLTLDADVICTRPVRYGDLVKSGKAIGERFDHPPNSKNYDRAAQILRLPRSTWAHPVTPSILSRKAVQMMQQHIATFIPKPVRLFPRFGNWRGYLLLNQPWTEYTLYATFVSGLGLYHQFHFKDDYYSLYGNSVWRREQFDTWDPAKSFMPEADYYFVVVQSNTGVDPAVVWAKVAPYFDVTESANARARPGED